MNLLFQNSRALNYLNSSSHFYLYESSSSHFFEALVPQLDYDKLNPLGFTLSSLVTKGSFSSYTFNSHLDCLIFSTRLTFVYVYELTSVNNCLYSLLFDTVLLLESNAFASSIKLLLGNVGFGVVCSLAESILSSSGLWIFS